VSTSDRLLDECDDLMERAQRADDRKYQPRWNVTRSALTAALSDAQLVEIFMPSS
jgi:hypothetical protein